MPGLSGDEAGSVAEKQESRCSPEQDDPFCHSSNTPWALYSRCPYACWSYNADIFLSSFLRRQLSWPAWQPPRLRVAIQWIGRCCGHPVATNAPRAQDSKYLRLEWA